MTVRRLTAGAFLLTTLLLLWLFMNQQAMRDHLRDLDARMETMERHSLAVGVLAAEVSIRSEQRIAQVDPRRSPIRSRRPFWAWAE